MAGYFGYELEDIILNLRMGDHEVSDHIVEQILSSKQQMLIDSLLEGSRIDRIGRLHVGEKLSVQGDMQHAVDYAIWRIILGTPDIVKLEVSLNLANIHSITFRFHTNEISTYQERRTPVAFKIPPEIGKISHLRSLSLVGLDLVDVPREIGLLNSLQELDLSDNPLGFLPSCNRFPIGLKKLRLRNCKISKLPRYFKSLTSLRMLDLSNNLLSRTPMVLMNLSKLTWLDISNNQLVNIGASFRNIASLRMLFMGGNREIHIRKIHSLPISLRYLELTYCAFKELPDSIGQLDQLHHLILKNTNLIILPGSIATLSNLRKLDISDNQELRYIEPYIAHLPKLKYVQYEELNSLLPQHFIPSHGEGIEGFRNLLDDVRYVFHNQTVDSGNPDVFRWIHLWSETNFDALKMHKSIWKAYKESIEKDFFLRDLLHEKTTEDQLLEAISIMKLLDMRFHLKALLCALRIRNGKLYAMIFLRNIFNVPEHLVRDNGVRIIATLSEDLMFYLFGERLITETWLSIPDSIILPETFKLKTKRSANNY